LELSPRLAITIAFPFIGIDAAILNEKGQQVDVGGGYTAFSIQHSAFNIEH